MRSTNLRPAFAAAATLLALAPAAASAAGGHARLDASKHANSARCHLTLVAAPPIVTSGEPVEVFGQVCPGGTSTVSQPVTIFARTPGSGFKSLGTLSSAAGAFSLKLPSVATDTVFYARSGTLRSPNRRVKVAPVVTFAPAGVGGASPTSLVVRTGKRNAVTFTGSVSPSDAGAVVALQRESSSSTEEWTPIQLGVVRAGSTYTIKHAFVVPGDANLRVVVRPHGTFTERGVSESLSFAISEPQNPNLTLETSPNPVASGQAVTLKGVVKGGASQKVVLMGRTNGLPMTKIGETTADGTGAYTFPEKPLMSTIYKATAGTVSSTGQFEGVKYVLTAAPSAPKVQAGQPFTVTGTVSPIQSGHPVYLERQNAFGGGFHVIDVGSLSPTGTFSINHPLFGSGNVVLRVHAPGGPANQGASSPTFTVEVTPAPPATLHPVPPSRLPGEGKI